MGMMCKYCTPVSQVGFVGDRNPQPSCRQFQNMNAGLPGNTILAAQSWHGIYLSHQFSAILQRLL